MLAGAAGAGLAILVAGVVVIGNRVAAADAADLDAGQQAFSVADCPQVQTHAARLEGRWRPPWTDAPVLTGPVEGCTALDAALTGSPSTQAVALANLGADTP
ncbi:MAG: hypothetical protein R2761_30245, partial [Acidimicrobiales bacterium]